MSSHEITTPTALTIAGLDPSGGAGVIADIRAFTAFGCSAAAAITSITFQNDREIFGADHLSVETIRGQVMAIVDRSIVAGVKTGMLPTREIVREVVRLFRETGLPAPVVDPVICSTSGFALIEEDALEVLLNELLPVACVVTPNIPEAEQITGLRIKDLEGMRAAADVMRARGARAVLIKGGHLGPQASCLPESQGKTAGVELTTKGGPGAAPARRMRAVPGEAIDLLDNEGHVTVFRGEWIAGANLRGTGCLLSAAIAACLGKGQTLEESVSQARRFVADAIKAKATHPR
jgi:hydroxymethylpyrimidine/phosphomethylpyrimidine kinase